MAERNEKMSTKILVIIFIGVAFLAGFLVSRARYKTQITELNSMVIERDDKISSLNNLRNRLTMRDNQLIQIMDGESTIVESDVALEDGTKVSEDGLVTKPDGESIQLNSGDSIFMDGSIMDSETMMKMQSEDEE